MNIVSYNAFIPSFTGSNEKLSAQFCNSLNEGLQRYEEEIQLTNMNKVNHGHIRMPEDYAYQSITRECWVTFSGSADGIIVFHHQRLSNATSGLCLRATVINDTIYEGQCSDQRVYFSRVKKIALIIGKPIQDSFILHFTGMEKWLSSGFKSSNIKRNSRLFLTQCCLCFRQLITLFSSHFHYLPTFLEKISSIGLSNYGRMYSRQEDRSWHAQAT